MPGDDCSGPTAGSPAGGVLGPCELASVTLSAFYFLGLGTGTAAQMRIGSSENGKEGTDASEPLGTSSSDHIEQSEYSFFDRSREYAAAPRTEYLTCSDVTLSFLRPVRQTDGYINEDAVRLTCRFRDLIEGPDNAPMNLSRGFERDE